MTALVDSNVLLDVLTEDSEWFTWSAEQLARVADQEGVAINPLILAEVSIGFESQDEVEESLPTSYLCRLPLPWEAAFQAGKAFLEYRRRGGSRRSPLPDFYIGAHTQVEGLRLLTRDEGRYRTYFPDLPLITP